MESDRIIARLEVEPAWIMEPRRTYTLHQATEATWIQVITQQGESTQQELVHVSSARAAAWMRRLKSVRIPVCPVSPNTLDGAYYQLTIEGQFASLTLRWWTVVPEGAEQLGKFVRWLESSVA